MKIVKLIIVILFLPFCSFCQTLTGLWVGALTNDSSTIRRDQSFEMALTEYRGKVYGYSHTTFMVHDTLFYVVKRVKGTINGNVCEVKDDELVSCNFMTKLDKGVKQTYTFRLNTQDSLWRLDGEWKTTKTKNFYSLSGTVKTATEKDLTKSKLYPHLQELKLKDGLASVEPPKKETEVVAKTETKKPEIVKAEPKERPVIATPKADIAKVNTEKEKKPDPVKTKPPVDQQKDVVVKVIPEKEKQSVKNEPAKSEPIVIKPKENTEIINKSIAAANVEKRKSETSQIVEFKTDSLILSLYDNGEIDGDTVSVLINGEVVMPNQGLRATAIRKTIYITPAMQDSFTLTLYAENLGKYPPNTGLILVRDGEDVYQVRFSADLQKNVAVIFKRKKK